MLRALLPALVVATLGGDVDDDLFASLNGGASPVLHHHAHAPEGAGHQPHARGQRGEGHTQAHHAQCYAERYPDLHAAFCPGNSCNVASWAVTKAGSRRRRGYNVDSSWTEVALSRWLVHGRSAS